MVPSVDGTKLEPMLLGEQRPFKLQKKEETGWTIPVSATASKTNHSARDLVQPIVDEIKLGMHRLDGKNPISLAVSYALLHNFLKISLPNFSSQAPSCFSSDC
jgi:hypothetical protein